MSVARPDKLSVVVFSGDYDRVHYALAMAAAAAAIGTPTTLFFTMGACRALLAPGPDGARAWRKLPVDGDNEPIATDSASVARFSGVSRAGAKDDGYGRSGIATFEELLSSCRAMEVRFLVCEMGLKAIGIDAGRLRQDLGIEIAGLVTFLNDASRDGGMIFV